MVRKTIKYLLPLFVIALGVQSCYYDNEEELYPNFGTCDTSNVTYSGVVTPIIQQNCYSCHSNAQSAIIGSGISLEGHANISCFIGANQTVFLNAIQHLAGASAMPKNSAKMSDCNINKIKAWINAGMPNN